MKTDETDKDIASLLQARKPGVEVPSALEGRILRAIGEDRYRKSPVAWWKWLAVPVAALLLIVLLAPQKKEEAPAVVEQGKTSPEMAGNGTGEKGAEGDESINPLTRESRALKRDAERAGRFLLDSLPSVNSVSKR